MIRIALVSVVSCLVLAGCDPVSTTTTTVTPPTVTPAVVTPNGIVVPGAVIAPGKVTTTTY